MLLIDQQMPAVLAPTATQRPPALNTTASRSTDTNVPRPTDNNAAPHTGARHCGRPVHAFQAATGREKR
eukprot:SAG25_NODE_21_length_22373_cov_13.904373_24_plen_69_part_00